MALLLGDDGRGYELARKLESHGVWRPWLGDSHYSAFVHFLSSPTLWEVFMRADDNKTRAQLHLQLRARALLFDKASISLFLRSNHSSSSSSSSQSPLVSSNSVHKLNPNYLQLHGDDVYFTLDNSSQDAAQSNASSSSSSKFQSKPAFGAARYGESESEPMSLRFKHEELPETWYGQFFDKYKASKSYRVSFGDQETEKRTPEQMSIYLRVLEKHKRRRIAFREDQHIGFGNSILENGSNIISNAVDDETPFFPETMFTMNSVPDRAILRTNYVGYNQKLKFNGVLDTLPQVMSKSPVINPIMIERLGIRPEYLSMEQGGGQSRWANVSGGSKKAMSEEIASQMSQKVIVRFLSNMGFEASSEVPLEVLAQLLSCHIGKLGRTLKLLADSYRKQCSAIELIKMFLHTTGHSNLGALSELVKDNTRSSVQQAHQHMQGIQSQLQLQQQASIRQSQQIGRQMHPQMQQINPQMQQMNPQMQQMINSQSIAFQQQQHLERMRRRQPTPRPGMSMNTNMNMTMNTNMNMITDQDRPLVQVKLEAPSDFTIDNNAFNNSRQAQLQQFRQQQQLAAMSSLQAQPNNQFRTVGSPQIPQMHSPNTGMVRAPPVKVEGFQELMGGDATLKLDSEENRLMSPK